MGKLYYPSTQNAIQKTLDAQLLQGTVSSVSFNNVVGLQNKPTICVVDRVDTAGNLTPNKREYFSFDTLSSNTGVTLVRGLGGSTDQDHAVGAIVEIVNDVVQQQAIIDALLKVVDTNGNLNKATGAEVDTGTDDAKIITSKALADSNYITATSAPVTLNNTVTLDNKRINPRIVTAASYTTDTGTALDVSTCDEFDVTAQAGALKLNNPSGTPVNGQKLIVRIKDDGTARALTYDTQFRASSDLALPTTTVLSKTLYMGFVYNSADTKWDLLALLNNI